MIPKYRAWYTPFKGEKFGQEMKYGQAGRLITHAEMSPDNYVLMQSTGLKDKNGVEIFEGDILHRRVHVILSGTNLNEWVDEYIHVEWKYGGWHVGEDLLEFVIEEGIDRHTFFRQTAVEVVGNIYENNELLEEQR